MQVLTEYAHLIGKNLAQIETADIRAWIVSKLSRVSPETINGRLRVWNVFYQWLIEEGDLSLSPLHKVSILKTDQHPPPVLSASQMSDLLAHFNPREFYGCRNRNVCLVLLDTAIRVGELCNIRIEDLDLIGGTIQIPHTKSRRHRCVPISTRTAKSLHSYIRRFHPVNPTGPLFLSESGEPITPNAVLMFMQKLRKHLGFKVYPHLLRHTSVTMMLEAGASVAIVQKICGHSDIRVTQRYSHIDDKVAKSEHDRYSPVMRMKGA
jgi:integrase/recombinase XerD